MSLSNTAFAQNPKPFLKWVGGKTQLINELDKLISHHMSKYNTYTYIEPFVGGGAVLFYILSNFPQINNIIINDINSNLISTYKLIKEDYRKLLLVLAEIEQTYYNLTSLENKQQFYLAKRDEFNQEDSEFSLVDISGNSQSVTNTAF